MNPGSKFNFKSALAHRLNAGREQIIVDTAGGRYHPNSSTLL
jgi:hypothetical protein